MFKQYRKIEEGEQIIVSLDCAQGGADYTAMQTISIQKLDCPIVYHSTQATNDFIPTLSHFLDSIADTTKVKPTIAIERNNGGLLHAQRLAGLNLKHKYVMFKMPGIGRDEVMVSADRFGWDTNASTRPVMVSELRTAIHQGLIHIYDKITYLELLSFIVNKQGRPQAENNKHDDLLMSLAIAWQVYQTTPQREEINVVHGLGDLDFPDPEVIFIR